MLDFGYGFLPLSASVPIDEQTLLYGYSYIYPNTRITGFIGHARAGKPGMISLPYP